MKPKIGSSTQRTRSCLWNGNLHRIPKGKGKDEGLVRPLSEGLLYGDGVLGQLVSVTFLHTFLEERNVLSFFRCNVIGLVITKLNMSVREEAKQGRNLVRNHFCRMIVAIIHQADAIIPGRCIFQAPFRTADSVAFYTDAKDFRFRAGINFLLIKGLCQHLIKRLLIALLLLLT